MPTFMLIYFGIIAAGIIIGSVRYRTLSGSSRWILLLLVLTLLSEAVSYGLRFLLDTNLVTYHFFTVVQFLILAKAYYTELGKFRRLIGILIVLEIIAGVINLAVYRHELTTSFPAILNTFTDVLTVVLNLLYLRELLNNPTNFTFGDYPLFWISTGWLFFIMLTSVGLGTFNYIASNNPAYRDIFRLIRIGANYLLYGLFVVAFLSRQRGLMKP